MKKQIVTNGVFWVEIPAADLRILCGCPEDVVKHLKKNGFFRQEEKNGIVYETGPNAILLSDASIQNGSFANLAEFPVLQMFYKQGMILPDHPNNTGRKPILIGLEDQVRAQSQYIYRGNYGLSSVEEIMAAGIPAQQAEELMRMKIRFAFDKIRKTEELIEFRVIDKEAVELSENVFIHRKGFNIYEFLHDGESIIVDLNLSSEEKYPPPFELKAKKLNRDYFSVVHIGEGNGWDINRPCMASIITFQGKIYLIDAGPGITFSLKALGLSVNEVEGIFHTHAHDDHFAGLTALVRSDHLIKYYATPLVRSSVAKKLSALMSFEEVDFTNYFDVHDLEFDNWNNINGLEVKPVLSPHPVETSIFFFRAFGRGGFKSYAHLADIPSFSVLDKMATENDEGNGISAGYRDEVKKVLLTPVDLKKIDIGGGLIHGSAKDFTGDQSKKILLSHIDRDLTTEEKTIGGVTEFGVADVLIPAQQDYVLNFAFEYLRRYFPSIPDYDLRMLINCPIVEFEKDAVLLREGEKHDNIFLILSGLVEFINEDSGVRNTYSSTSLIGEWSGLLEKECKRTYRALSDIQSLQIPCDLYREFIKRNKLFDDLLQKQEKRHFLQSTWLFGELVSFPIQNEITGLMAKRVFDGGEELPCETDENLYLLATGEIKIFSGNRVIETLKPGQFFGEEHLLHKYSHLYRAVVTKKSEIFIIPGKGLENIPVIQWKLLETFERRLKLFSTHFEFEWRDAFRVDVAALDSQHKDLFQLINRLYQFSGDDASVAGMLDTIFEKMKQHFAYEENLMNQHTYSYLEQQKQEHGIMLEEISRFKRDMKKNKKPNLIDFLTSLKEHLIMHTLIEDKKYRIFFKEKGVS